MSSNSVSKRIKGLRTETNTGVLNTFIDVFTADILPEILDNLEILTVKDLLNFRLVNRCWRDAATSVLLKRNLCEIVLKFSKVFLDEDGNGVAQSELWKMGFLQYTAKSILPFDNYFNAYQPKSFLSDLNQLISNSPKFPSTSIRFDQECGSGFGNLCPKFDLASEDGHQKDLFHFLSLYGKKIKKLSLSCGISKEAVQKLLYVHMTNLICLDLENFERFSIQEHDQGKSKIKVCLLPPSPLKIKELIVGNSAYRFMEDKCSLVKELMGVCPNLSSISKVDVLALGIFLEMGKCHLIKVLDFDPSCLDMTTVHQFTKLVADTNFNNNSFPIVPKVKIGDFTIRFQRTWGYGTEFDVMKFPNIILSSIKDSLTCLDLHVGQSNRHIHVFIPPLPHLKSLRLVDFRGPYTTHFHLQGDVIGNAMQSGEITASESVDDFNALIIALQNQDDNKIRANYFPSLRNVILHLGKMKANSDKLMNFFSLEHLGPDGVTTIPGDTLLPVTTLELITFRDCDVNVSKLFPNVSHLKIRAYSFSDMQNWIWTAFPKLEQLEIHGLCQGSYAKVMDMDCFFTGISPELCTKLGRKTMLPKKSSRSAPVVKRTQPYIGDCRNLKIFKINFREKLCSKFSSELAAVYGLKEVMLRTKIIFSFEDAKLSFKEMQETRQYLDPVSECVEIRMRK